MQFEHLQDLMDRLIVTINSYDMDFSSYTKEELDWLYDYCIEYKPEGYGKVIKAILNV